MPPQGLATPRNTIATAKLAPKFLSFSEIPEPDLSEGDDDDDGDDSDDDDDDKKDILKTKIFSLFLEMLLSVGALSYY